MAKPHPLHDQAIADIQQHLAKNGSKDWGALVAKYCDTGDVNKTTFWRWIAEAKEVGVTPGILTTAKAKIRQQLKRDVSKHLPVAPSPNYVAQEGERAMANIDYAIEIKRLYGDANLLREYGMAAIKDDDGNIVGEKIKNPHVFERSIKARADLLDQGLRAISEIWELRRIQNFYQIVIETIGEESPECQKRILTRLAALNAQHGMTMDARV